MRLRDYRDKILEVLRVAPYSAADVFDAMPTGDYHSRPRRYMVLLMGREAVPSDRLTGPQSDHDVQFRVRAVGRTPNEAMAVADTAYERLTNAPLTLEGRNSRPVRHVDSDGILFDPDVGDGLYFFDDVYSWFTTKG